MGTNRDIADSNLIEWTILHHILHPIYGPAMSGWSVYELVCQKEMGHMGWDLFGWKFIGTHLGSLIISLIGVVMAFASPETQFPAYLLLLAIGALGITAGQVDAAILRRLERLERLEQARSSQTKETATPREG
jgi:hypothetical protein